MSFTRPRYGGLRLPTPKYNIQADLYESESGSQDTTGSNQTPKEFRDASLLLGYGVGGNTRFDFESDHFVDVPSPISYSNIPPLPGSQNSNASRTSAAEGCPNVEVGERSTQEEVAVDDDDDSDTVIADIDRAIEATLSVGHNGADHHPSAPVMSQGQSQSESVHESQEYLRESQDSNDYGESQDPNDYGEPQETEHYAELQVPVDKASIDLYINTLKERAGSSSMMLARSPRVDAQKCGGSSSKEFVLCFKALIHAYDRDSIAPEAFNAAALYLLKAEFDAHGCARTKTLISKRRKKLIEEPITGKPRYTSTEQKIVSRASSCKIEDSTVVCKSSRRRRDSTASTASISYPSNSPCL